MEMGFFKHIEGEAAIIVENGVYKQVDLYVRDDYLYVKGSGGFIRLMADGSTTKPKTRLDMISFDGPLYRDHLGRLCCGVSARGAKPLTGSQMSALQLTAGEDKK